MTHTPPEPWELALSLSADAHVNEHTQFGHHLYPSENRVTVDVRGVNSARVTLFLPRAQLLRLRDALSAVAEQLDAEMDALRRALDQEITNSAA